MAPCPRHFLLSVLSCSVATGVSFSPLKVVLVGLMVESRWNPLEIAKRLARNNVNVLKPPGCHPPQQQLLPSKAMLCCFQFHCLSKTMAPHNAVQLEVVVMDKGGLISSPQDKWDQCQWKQSLLSIVLLLQLGCAAAWAVPMSGKWAGHPGAPG